jgi:chemotaxis signal transduction protein
LPLLLGFDSGPRSERLIVLTDQHGPTALRVDQLQPIINLDPEQCTLSQSDSEKDCIRSVINWRERMINLFDLEHFQLQLNDLCSGEGD